MGTKITIVRDSSGNVKRITEEPTPTTTAGKSTTDVVYTTEA